MPFMRESEQSVPKVNGDIPEPEWKYSVLYDHNVQFKDIKRKFWFYNTQGLAEVAF